MKNSIEDSYSIFLGGNTSIIVGDIALLNNLTIWGGVRVGVSSLEKSKTEIEGTIWYNHRLRCIRFEEKKQNNTHKPRDSFLIVLCTTTSVCPWFVNRGSAGQFFHWIFFSALAKRSRSLSFLSIAAEQTINFRIKSKSNYTIAIGSETGSEGLSARDQLSNLLSSEPMAISVSLYLTRSRTCRIVPGIWIWFFAIWNWCIHFGVFLCAKRDVCLLWCYTMMIGGAWHQISASNTMVWWQVASENCFQVWSRLEAYQILVPQNIVI